MRNFFENDRKFLNLIFKARIQKKNNYRRLKEKMKVETKIRTEMNELTNRIKNGLNKYTSEVLWRINQIETY